MIMDVHHLWMWKCNICISIPICWRLLTGSWKGIEFTPQSGTCIQLTLELSCHHTIPLFLLSAVKKSFFAWLLQPCCHFCFSDVLSGAVGNPIQKRAPLHSHAGRVAENCRPPCKPPCHETPCLCWSYPSSSMSVVIARCHRAMGAPFNAGGLMEGILATLQATQHLHRFSKKFKGSWWGKQPLDMDIFFGWVGLRFNESVQSVNSTQQTLHSKFWIHLSSVGDKIDH